MDVHLLARLEIETKAAKKNRNKSLFDPIISALLYEMKTHVVAYPPVPVPPIRSKWSHGLGISSILGARP